MKTLFLVLVFASLAHADEYIVKVKHSFATLPSVRILDRHPAGRLLKVDVDANSLASLRARDEVEYVVPNIRIYPDRFSSSVSSQWSLQQIGAEAAWTLAGNRGSRKVTVAVIDSGVERTHPGLAANMVAGFDFVTGRADQIDQLGHGTHCVGVVGAVGQPSAQMSGMSPVISIMPLRFMNNLGGGSLYDAIRASDFAIEHGADVISASWGAQLSTKDLEKPLTEMVERTDHAGVIFVAAVGNRSRDNDTIPYFPSNAQFPTMIAVGATDPTDAIWSLSNFGAHHVHIAAPGSDILSTYLGGSYKSMSGTSMATPLVAGLVAFMKAQNPSLKPADYRRILQETGRPAQMINACHCRIDAEAAVRRAIELRP